MKKLIKMMPHRMITLGLCIAVAATLLAGCGGTEKGTKACKDILESLKKNTEYGFDTIYANGDGDFDDNFEFLYDFDKSLIDDGAIMFIKEGGFADEISIFHVKKDEDVKIVKEKLELRKESRLQVFSAYKPEEASKVSNAKVISGSKYVALVISADNDMVETEIRKVISE